MPTLTINDLIATLDGIVGADAPIAVKVGDAEYPIAAVYSQPGAQHRYIIEVDTDPRCPSCDEPLKLIRSGAVGHSGDEYGNDCPPLVDVTPSLFPGAPPVRTYSDGSQAYGPYA